MVKAMMASIGLDPARFGAHSLRIGGATAALAAGLSPAAINVGPGTRPRGSGRREGFDMERGRKGGRSPRLG